MKWFRRVAIGLLVVVVLLAASIRLTTYHPPLVEASAVTCPAETPTLQPGQDVTVLSWNVQYMAGKGYVFFYDLLDSSGPDTRPSSEDIALTFDEVARVIVDEQPDVLLLQEVDDGAKRTDGEDQLARLLPLIGDDYACHASALYWKASFVPLPTIFGSVGMKLSTVSKYRIDDATRFQLPQMPSDLLTRQFDIRRAILETRLPIDGGQELVVLNTHLDAFAQGSDTMERQVALTKDLLDGYVMAGEAFIIGGDFNLLPPGPQYDRLGDAQRAYYSPNSELSVLTDEYGVVPTLDEANGADMTTWFTHFPNDPAVDAPDRTIDFLFHAPTLTLGDHEVRSADTLDISDHLPVIATYSLP